MTEWLDKHTIEDMLSVASKQHLKRLEIFPSIDSTNSYLLEQAKLNGQSGFVCLAEEQTQGRGRRGKEWYSPKGSNIYCSLLWHYAHAQSDMSFLSLAVAVVMVRALERYGLTQGLQLKWPNDVYYADRKLGGILIEALATQSKNVMVVIGIGLNLQRSADHPYAANAIAVEEIVGNTVSRNQLTGLLLDELLKQLHICAESGFESILSEWREYDMLHGKSVILHAAEREISGVAQGINAHGELILLDENGKRRTFRSGEVSVKTVNRSRP